MRAALVAEYRKFFTTRMWWVLALVLLGYLAVMAPFVAMGFVLEPEGEPSLAALLSDREIAQTVYAITSPLGYVFALIIGSLSVTGEFRHKTITATLLVEPRRSVLVVAKLLASIPLGLAYGLIATIAVVATGAPFLQLVGDGAFLGDSAIVQTLAWSVLVMALWTLLGVAFGTVVPNQVACVVIVLAFTQLVEPLLRLGLGAVDALQGVGQYLPGAAAEAVLGSSIYSTFMGSGSELLPRWAGLLVMLAYIAAAAVIGRLTTFRRDIA